MTADQKKNVTEARDAFSFLARYCQGILDGKVPVKPTEIENLRQFVGMLRTVEVQRRE